MGIDDEDPADGESYTATKGDDMRKIRARRTLVAILFSLFLPEMTSGCEVEYGWIPAWEVESKTKDGEHEVFVDEMGTRLFEVVKLDEDEVMEPLEMSDLPESLRDLITCLLDGKSPRRVRREREWGLAVVAVKWRGAAGAQEIKALEDGTLLYLEVGAGGKLPEAVRKSMAPDSKVEAMHLFLSPPVLERIQAAGGTVETLRQPRPGPDLKRI